MWFWQQTTMRLGALCRWFESTPSDYEQCKISERIWCCFMNFLCQRVQRVLSLQVVWFSLHSPQVGSSMVERVSPKHLTGVRFLTFLFQFIFHMAGLLVESGVTLTATQWKMVKGSWKTDMVQIHKFYSGSWTRTKSQSERKNITTISVTHTAIHYFLPNWLWELESLNASWKSEKAMNRIMHSIGLESRPRWIEMEAIEGHRYRYMCSSCGEIIYKRTLPVKCPNCGERMKQSNY